MEEKIDEINKKIDAMKRVHNITIVVTVAAITLSAIHLYHVIKKS